MSKLIFKTKPKTIIDTYEVDTITDRMTYIFEKFIELRGNRPKDKSSFARCPACQKKHQPTDTVYAAFNVRKNGKYIGNKFACADCFELYGVKL